MTNNETERARLTGIYSKMTDDELAEILGDEKSLTEIAKAALGAELSSRGIAWEPASGGKQAQEFPADDVDAAQHSEPLVMVKRFRDLPEALIAKSILDSAQLDSFLADETTVRFSWFYSNLIGGAKLMVRPEDLDEAIKLLAEANLAGSESPQVGSNQPGEEHE